MAHMMNLAEYAVFSVKAFSDKRHLKKWQDFEKHEDRKTNRKSHY